MWLLLIVGLRWRLRSERSMVHGSTRAVCCSCFMELPRLQVLCRRMANHSVMNMRILLLQVRKVVHHIAGHWRQLAREMLNMLLLMMMMMTVKLFRMMETRLHMYTPTKLAQSQPHHLSIRKSQAHSFHLQ